MALKTFVKISEVNNLSDARYCAGMTVDLMGFNMNPDSQSYVSPENFLELTGWVSGVEFVGEFGMMNETSIQNALADYELDFIQTDNEAILPLIKDHKKILRFNMDTIKSAKDVAEVMRKTQHEVSYYLFESDNGISYKENILDQLFNLASQYPVILGINITEENVIDFIENKPIKGISLKGGEEIRPGFKDFDELADILEALEIDDTDEGIS